jgi:hypothetical protein
MKIITPLIVIISFTSFSIAQDKDNLSRDWKIGIGYQNARILDRNVSPLIYSSNNGYLSTTYFRNKENKKWNIGLNISAGSSQSKRHGRRTAVILDAHPIVGQADFTLYEINPGLSYIDVELFYSMLWQVKDNNPLYAGFELSERLFYGGLGADTWFFNQVSIMPSVQKTIYNKQPYRVDIRGSIPLFSYLLRQPYTLDPSLPEESYLKAYLKSGSSFATLNEFQQFNLKADFTYQLKNGKRVGMSWLFMWMNYNNIHNGNMRSYSNSILFNYQF